MFDRHSLTLLVITDDLRDGGEGLIARAAAAVVGGATMVQLRLKHADARTLVEVARGLIEAVRVPVIVNDRADVAIAAGAAGVHLGVDDMPASAVRRIAPADFVIGASVGSDAEVLLAEGADYVGVGPVFGTVSKLDAGAAIGVEEMQRLIRRCGLPAVGIGGVDETNARLVIDGGADGVAVIRSVLSSADPGSAARTLRSAIGR